MIAALRSACLGLALADAETGRADVADAGIRRHAGQDRRRSGEAAGRDVRPRRSLRYAAIVVALGAGVAVRAEDVPSGEATFTQRCSMCHTIVAGQPHGIGPNLAGVVGRKAAGTAFAYSAALRASGLVWDGATLDRFLTAPSKLVPGTRMVVAVSDPTQRAGLIAYLSRATK